MRKNTLIYIYRTFIVLLVLIALTSCNQSTPIKKEFVWDEDIKVLTEGKLYEWLKKKPFDNEVDRGRAGSMLFTHSRKSSLFKSRYSIAILELDTEL